MISILSNLRVEMPSNVGEPVVGVASGIIINNVKWSYVGCWKDRLANEVGVCMLQLNDSTQLTIRGQFQRGKLDGVCELSSSSSSSSTSEQQFSYVGEIVQNSLNGFGELRVGSKFYSGSPLVCFVLFFF